MAAKDKDLAELRGELQSLATRISRFSLITFLLLLLIVTAFSRAFSRVNGKEVKELIAKIEELRKESYREPQLSYIFRVLLKSVPEQLEVSPERSAAAALEQAALEEKLEAQAEQWFSIKYSLLGTSLEFDLRYWGLFLPLLFWCGGSYLYILRAKRSVIAKIAAHRLAESDPAEASSLDRLLFGSSEKPPYFKFPSQLEAFAYTFCISGLTLYLVWITSSLWPHLDPQKTIVLAEFGFSVTVWVISYSLYVHTQLLRQSQALTGIPESESESWLSRIRLRVSRFRARLGWLSRLSKPLRKPHRKLLTGSSLILLTLVLTMASSCPNGEWNHAKGYEVLLAKETWMQWITADTVSDPLLQSDLAGLSPQLDRVAYGISIILAALSVAFFLIPRARRVILETPPWPVRFAKLSGLLAIYFLSDLFFVNLEYPGAAIVYHFSWVVPVYLWLRYRFPQKEELRARWPAIRTALWVIYLPGLPASLYFIGFYISFLATYGYPIFFVGLLLVARAYVQFAAATVPAVEPEQTDQGQEDRDGTQCFTHHTSSFL